MFVQVITRLHAGNADNLTHTLHAALYHLLYQGLQMYFYYHILMGLTSAVYMHIIRVIKPWIAHLSPGSRRDVIQSISILLVTGGHFLSFMTFRFSTQCLTHCATHAIWIAMDI